jgi:hypothetical protein
MSDFINSAFRASRLLGGPHRLARSLGVEPDELYRWIAGQDLPGEPARQELQKRMTLAMVAAPALEPGQRRHGDR